jgi:NADH-quinone oxidoreductase subunit J
MNTMETLGQVLYTHYFMYLLMAGVVLLVAMIGAIVLTRSPRLFAVAKRQELSQQLSRNPDNAVMMVRLSNNK